LFRGSGQFNGHRETIEKDILHILYQMLFPGLFDFKERKLSQNFNPAKFDPFPMTVAVNEGYQRAWR
jgi:hypothetical protein